MRDVKQNLLILLSIGFLVSLCATAQDDLDFDALVDELSTNEAPAKSGADVTEDPLAAFDEPAAEEVAEDPLAAFDEPAVEEVADDPLAAFDEPAVEEVTDDPLAAFDEPAAEETVKDPLALFEGQELVPMEEELATDDADSFSVESDDAMDVVSDEVPEGNVDEPAAKIEPVNPAAQSLSTAEVVNRQAREMEGLKSLQEGYARLADEKYAEALDAFVRAKSNLPIRPATSEAVQQAVWGQIEANYRLAKNAIDQDNVQDAERFANAVLKLEPLHRGAGRILAKVEKIKRTPLPEIAIKDSQDYLDQKANIEDLFNKGRQYFDAKDYDTAQVYFERILIIDPYHINSMRFLRKISDQRYAIYSRELKTTQANMIQAVRDTWNPPIEGGVEIPDDVRNQETQTTVSDAAILEEKMQEIIIPSIEFRQANIQDVVNFLVEASIIGDPSGQGVNIILNLNQPGSAPGVGGGGGLPPQPEADPFASDDPFADPFADVGDNVGFDQGDFGGGTPGGTEGITMNLRRVKLMDAIRYITEVANLKYRIEATAVIITPSDVPSGRVITRVYPVLPSFLEVVVDRPIMDDSDRSGEFIALGARQTDIGSRGDNVKNFFIQAGIPFPQGTSITYNPSISSLIVANTQENIELFERLLPQFNVVPNQVEIEARFVEVAQTDIEQLGFEWFFTDDYEILTQKGPGPVATKERVQIDADPEGASKGVRFLNLGSAGIEAGSKGAATALNPLGDILSFSSVLTNPEMSLIIHALDQNGNADVLSAPRVTTRSGVNAIIEVVQEIIYPTEFETNISTLSAQNDGGGTSQQQFVTITPGSFETRETGVILNVLPTVGPDGYTIELVLAPEVAELVDWLDYGGTQGGIAYRIPQPVFASRNVTTSMVIWDGQTVVMGGLISERLLTINDKIPILGDIPLLGRFFQNKGESSEKRNLLIFVTARVVDPAGKPIRRAEPTAAQAEPVS